MFSFLKNSLQKNLSLSTKLFLKEWLATLKGSSRDRVSQQVDSENTRRGPDRRDPINLQFWFAMNVFRVLIAMPAVHVCS